MLSWTRNFPLVFVLSLSQHTKTFIQQPRNKRKTTPSRHYFIFFWMKHHYGAICLCYHSLSLISLCLSRILFLTSVIWTSSDDDKRYDSEIKRERLHFVCFCFHWSPLAGKSWEKHFCVVYFFCFPSINGYKEVRQSKTVNFFHFLILDFPASSVSFRGSSASLRLFLRIGFRISIDSIFVTSH